MESAQRLPTAECVDRLKERNRHLKSQMEGSKVKIQELEDSLRKSEHEISRLRMQLEDKEVQHVSERQLLEQRTRELQCVQSYLTPVRSYSGRELIDLVEDLNTEVLHAAASITDAVDLSTPRHDDFMDTQGYVARARTDLGNEVVNILQRSSRSSDAFRTILQNTLQAAILWHLEQVLNFWSADPNISRILAETYESSYDDFMQSTEYQSLGDGKP
ncbi:hypothetical protein L218DRAFT_393056 [Marasmius fiardii PR-910]|nr:hypothetical protein L218DRAFT_393056 [Marasmius fiardii PR-910]